MTTATRPRSVYWRRRALLAAAGSVALVMLVKSCASSGPPHLGIATRKLPAVPVTDTYTPTPTPTQTASPTASPGVQADVMAEGPTAAPTGAPTATATALPTGLPTAAPTAKPAAKAAPAAGAPVAAAVPTAIPLCAKSDLGVELRADAPTYSKAAKPKFYIGISNIGKAPCQVDLGSVALAFTVHSGPDRIWSSRDCQGKGVHDVRTLAPGQKLWGRSIWSKTRSKPGCPSGEQDAQPGTYTLEGSAAGVKAQKRVVFRIR